MRKRIILLLLTFVQSTCSLIAQTSSSLDGALLYEGTYTLTGKAIQGGQVTTLCAPSLCTLRICENRMYFNNDPNYSYYSGDETLFNIKWRKYVTDQNSCYYVSDAGGVMLALTSTSYVPFMGNVTSTGYVLIERGDTRGVQFGSGNVNGDNYGGSVNNGSTNSQTSSFQSQYDMYERTVKNTWNTLTGMTNGASRTAVRMQFRNAQAQMRHVRQNAQMAGVHITASPWENAQVPYGLND